MSDEVPWAVRWWLKYGRRSEIIQKGSSKGRYRTESIAGTVVTGETFDQCCRRLADYDNLRLEDGSEPTPQRSTDVSPNSVTEKKS